LAPGLKTLEDAREIRTRFLLAFERAEREPDPAEQALLLTFVVVGGGPTGVELAGILPTIARRGFKGDFRRIDPARIHVVLVEAGPRLLPTFPERLSKRAFRDLETLGVQCRTGAMVTRITEDSVYLGDERIPTRTVFWAAGNAASPLIRRMGLAVDRAGRAQVLPDLSVPGHPHVFIIGDAAAAEMTVPDVPRGHARPSGAASYVPGLATAAQQMGGHAAEGILRTLARKERLPFRYRDRGSMAVIGRNRAVALIGGLQLGGRVAFWLWLLVHIMYLAGFRNRLSVLVEWGYAYFTFRPGARLLTDLTPPPPGVVTQQPPQT
ncbi:MAG: FAD-dependent oxidoreductase, partial [Acidobacteria bacterium]|nr:FAD-dependent oxidoreductase [Acidobacteriota bacterium]